MEGVGFIVGLFWVEINTGQPPALPALLSNIYFYRRNVFRTPLLQVGLTIVKKGMRFVLQNYCFSIEFPTPSTLKNKATNAISR